MVDVDIMCPTIFPGPGAPPNTVLGYKNATRLPGCIANTSCKNLHTPALVVHRTRQS